MYSFPCLVGGWWLAGGGCVRVGVGTCKPTSLTFLIAAVSSCTPSPAALYSASVTIHTDVVGGVFLGAGALKPG